MLSRDRISHALISFALFLVLVSSAQAQGTSRTPSTSGGQGIAQVQSVSLDASNSNWATLAFGSSNAAGNFIAVVIQGGQPGEGFAVTDSQGNTYQQAIQTNEDAAGETIAVYYAMNIAGGANTVTVFQTILGSFRFAILEYSGVAKTNALDVAAAAQGASAFPNSGSVTTTANGDLLLGGVMTAGGQTYIAGTGYTIEQNVSASPNTKLIAEDQTQATVGASSAGASLGATDLWAAVLAAFKADASGVGAPPPSIPTVPTITNLNPRSGSVGTQVTITGTGFGPSMGTVKFNGMAATPTSWSSTSIVTAVPIGATTGNVVVTVGGVASNAVNFIITSTGAGIAQVQSVSLDASNSNWATLAFGSSNAAGNFIAVVIQGGQPGEGFAVTDSQGNTYQQAIQTNEDAAGETIAVYYAMNIAGGANTVTVFQTILGSFRFAILEYSGVAKTNALDVAAAAQGASAFPNSGSVTTTANGDLLLGGVMTAGGQTYIAGTGYTIEQNVSASPNTKLIAEDQTHATIGASSAGASLGATDLWAAVLAAFKADASGVGAPPSSNQGQLSASTLTLNFGNVNIGSSSSQTVTLSNSGNANVTISNIRTLGAGISASGIYVGLVLTPGQQALLNVTFAPVATMGVTGNVTVTSDATNSPTSIAVSGSGLQPTSHSVDLTWNASMGAVGYNVYRGTVSGGLYTLLTGAPITTTSFTDTNVQSGQAYYYVVTALNSNGVESTFSNTAPATIP